jgi:hypothetical protein
MNKEQWHAWHPLQKMTGKYTIKSYINNDFCNLVIILQQYNAEHDTEIKIVVDSVEAYRVTNETYKLKLWEYLSETHKELNRKWPLFIIENSTFLHFLSEQSKTISDDRHFKHYCIMDSEWSIDIATPTEPLIELFVNGILIETNQTDKHQR